MITINDLGFSYGNTPVLKNITMTLEDGKIYGLLGENGVGKTTLLTLISGLKKTQQGSISVDGHDPYKREPAFFESVYYLPDEVMPVNAKASVWAKEYGSMWPSFDLSKFKTIMAELEVDSSKEMNKMSAGQLKKTYISFALALNVKYLFMDEPTNALDIPSKAEFRSAILKYTADDSVVVISTHQVLDLENIIDPIIILDKQDVLVNASIEDIASKLYFDYGNILDPEALYSEQIPGGFIQVRLNPDGQDSKVNIEALFNAVHKHKDLIKGILKK